MQTDRIRYFARRIRHHLGNKLKDLRVDPTPGLWIDRPDANRSIAATEAEPWIKEFATELAQDGVAVVKGSIPKALCDEAVSFYEKYAVKLAQDGDNSQPSQGRGSYPRIVNLHTESDAFRRLFSRNTALPAIDFCFGQPASVYTSLTFQVGTQQPIHRDIPVFRTSPDARYFGMWVALEDADESNGPLMVVRQGHRGAALDPYLFAESRCANLAKMTNEDLQREMWIPYQEALAEMCEREGLTVDLVKVSKGDTVVWHALLPHGGSPIKSPGRSRYSCVFHVVPGQTPVYQADVFFKRNAKAPYSWPRKYYSYEGRLFLECPPPTFMA